MQEKTISDAQRVGISYATEVAYKAIDKADIPKEIKSALLFAHYSFLCIYDEGEKEKEHKILAKYGILDTQWDKEMDLYEMVYCTTSLKKASYELKAAWYLAFPFVLLLRVPHSEDLYEMLCKNLIDEKIFSKAIDSEYSIFVRDSVEELLANDDIPKLVADWYAPYIIWKNGKTNSGIMREEERFSRWLSQGKFVEVFKGTEKLLDTFPDDDGILVCNIAARVSLQGVTGEENRIILLKETLALIESALERGSVKKAYLLYYAGLCHLGLQNMDRAKEYFECALEEKNDFDAVKVMLKKLGD
ncbi:MAG: hypothetical protein FWC82_00185 [Firmicutes bacterium]|nr:hypothetical protein [Bacillota bacterium]